MALSRDQELFRLLVEAVQDYAIFMLDPGGHVTSWNKGAERLKGYKASEIKGRHFSCFYPLTNVHRHSASPTADVRLMVEQGVAILEVSDKGKGMPNGGCEKTNGAGVLGIGLRSMSERARQVGGILEVKSTPAGASVIASIPFEQFPSDGQTPEVSVPADDRALQGAGE